MARAKTDDPAPLVECTEAFASAWIDDHALSGFPGGVCRRGTLLRADDPFVKAHPQWFAPARASGEPREKAA